MTVAQERALAALTPMWQRIARGDIDLSQYSDEEILTGRIQMADGRLLPTPPTLPDNFVAEQVRRGLRKAQRKIREGAMSALEVYADILEDDTLEPRDRLKAGQFFLERFLGKETQHVHVTTDADAAREELVRRLVAARRGLTGEQQFAAATEDVVDGEVVEGTLALEDIL